MPLEKNGRRVGFSAIGQRTVALAALGFFAGTAATVAGCGDEGPFPTTVDPGDDFGIADVVFDEAYFYCAVEPVLFARRCGPGDPGSGDAPGGCHFNVTSFKLTDYSPLVAEGCSDLTPPEDIPTAARQNYQTSQARMKRDPELAALLNRPTGEAVHPRVIFDADSDEANTIREWATRFSSQ
ncbi:MAG TPA: hypothetical protein VF989_02020 [Polyangiaceae bacterium]|jgi:hypothetical protein